MLKVYLARGMTGRVRKDVVKEAKKDKKLVEKHGVVALCPVAEEGVKSTNSKLFTTVKQLAKFWKRDKEMIREAHVIFDMSPHLNSEGVKHEIGYARYFLWKKVIRVFPEGQLPPKASVAYYEDDYITDNLYDAILEAKNTHGSWYKRFRWRLEVYNRSFLKAVWYRWLEWLN